MPSLSVCLGNTPGGGCSCCRACCACCCSWRSPCSGSFCSRFPLLRGERLQTYPSDQGQCACCVSNLWPLSPPLQLPRPGTHPSICTHPCTPAPEPPCPFCSPCRLYYIWVCTYMCFFFIFCFFFAFLARILRCVVWRTQKKKPEKKLYILFEQMCKMLESRLRLRLVTDPACPGRPSASLVVHVSIVVCSNCCCCCCC